MNDNKVINIESKLMEKSLKTIRDACGDAAPPPQIFIHYYVVYSPDGERRMASDYRKCIESLNLPKGTYVTAERVIEVVNYKVGDTERGLDYANPFFKDESDE